MTQEMKTGTLTLAVDGAQQIDLEKMRSELLHILLTPLTNFIQSINMANNEARDNTWAAVEAYHSDLTSRQTGLKRQIDSLIDTIKECEQKSREAVDALGAAISSDNTENEEAAKKAVDEASIAEYMARRRLDALSKAKITGDDELFYAAIKAYSIMDERMHTSVIVCSKLKDILDEYSEQIKKIRELSETLGYNEASERVAMRKMWPMIEAHSGAVDFTRATAGDDNSCKVRYLKALARRYPDEGFIDSPAWLRLAEDLDKIIEHEEQADA